METRYLSFSLMAALGIAAFVASGCADHQQGPTPETSADSRERSQDDETAEALAKLSEEDRRTAESQKFCPVSDEPLGSMGTPIKVALGDKSVFICCSGCEAELKKNQEKYLAKLQP
jgi:hypothetical protein